MIAQNPQGESTKSHRLLLDSYSLWNLFDTLGRNRLIPHQLQNRYCEIAVLRANGKPQGLRDGLGEAIHVCLVFGLNHNPRERLRS